MRKTMLLLATAGLSACGSENLEAVGDGVDVTPAALTYQGGDYGDDEAAKVAHGERLSSVLLCKGCHTEALTGIDMGEFEPELAGVTASNLTLAVPELDDRELELILRKGMHPDRDAFYMMPSKIYQHVSDADMDALIAYLRTLEPAGEALPVASPSEELLAGGFAQSKDEIAAHADTFPADLGETHALGRYIATTTCADCHGPTLEGDGGFAPDLTQVATMYDEAALTRLLTTGEPIEGREIGLMGFLGGNLFSKMTDEERAALVSYVKALADAKMQEPQ